MKRLHLIIHGTVQGVFFRASTKEQAKELDVYGWVRNVPNGTVEVVAEGDDNSLKQLLSWCQQGPEHAVVERVEEEWSEISEFTYSSFEVVS